MKRLHTVSSPAIQGDGPVGLSLQGAADEPGQHSARTHLNKCMDPTLGHVVDKVHESDLAADLLGEASAPLFGAPGVGLGHLARPDRQLGFSEGDVGEKGAEGGGAFRHEGGVEGRADLQAAKGKARLFQCGFGSIDSVEGAGDDDLPGGVVVRNHHVRTTQTVQHRLDLVERCRHRAHGPGGVAGCRHELPAFAGHLQELLFGHDTGCVQRGHLAEAVAGHGVGLDAQIVQEGKQGQAGRADGWLGPLGGSQGGAVGLAFLFVEPGNGKDHVFQSPVRVQRLIRSPVPGTPCAVKGHGDGSPHAQVLAALAREQEGDAARVLPNAKGAPVRVLKRGFGGLFNGFRQAGKLLLQLVFRPGQEPQPGSGAWVKDLGTLPGDALQHSDGQLLRGQGACLLGDGSAVGSGQGHQLVGEGPQAGG